MTIVETHVTVSYRYYMRKTKIKISQAIQDLIRHKYGQCPMTLREISEGLTKSDLAHLAMDLHNILEEPFTLRDRIIKKVIDTVTKPPFS